MQALYQALEEQNNLSWYYNFKLAREKHIAISISSEAYASSLRAGFQRMPMELQLPMEKLLLTIFDESETGN